MKRKERQHLRENELAHSLTAVREFVEARRGQLTGFVIVVILIVAGILGITMWQRQGSVKAEQALADAMVTMNARVIPPSATGAAPCRRAARRPVPASSRGAQRTSPPTRTRPHRSASLSTCCSHF